MNPTPLSCPGCGTGLVARERDGIRLEECPACRGIWAGSAAWKRILARRQDPAIDPLDGGTEASLAPAGDWGEEVRYRPCPGCGERMNRINAGAGSGVVIDRCAVHGTWFDAGELARVRAAVRSGAWERARQGEIDRLRAKPTGLADTPAPGLALDLGSGTDLGTNRGWYWLDGFDLVEALVVFLFDG